MCEAPKFFFLHICKKAAQKLPPETNQLPTEIFLQPLFVVTGDQVVPVDGFLHRAPATYFRI